MVHFYIALLTFFISFIAQAQFSPRENIDTKVDGGRTLEAADTDYDYVSFSYNASNVLLAIDKYEDDLPLITHPNHSAISIEIGSVTSTQPRKCYDNFAIPAMGGLVTTFNDGYYSNNVSVVQKDSSAINSPQLINDLNPGLYKIEKYYNNGATLERIIQKGND